MRKLAASLTLFLLLLISLPAFAEVVAEQRPMEFLGQIYVGPGVTDAYVNTSTHAYLTFKKRSGQTKPFLEIFDTDGTTSLWKVDAAGLNTATDLTCTSCVALTTETSGNYVASVTTSALTGLTGGAAGSEGTAITLALDRTATIGADPAIVAGGWVASTTGIIFEGSTADGIEGLLTVADPTVADKTWTLPNVNGNIITSGDTATIDATMMGADSVAASEIAADSVGSSELVEAADYTVQTLKLSTPIITGGPNGTVNNAGEIRTQVYKYTVAYTNTDFQGASQNIDVTLGTFPAKIVVDRVIADITQAFVCGAVCTTATLSATTGKTAGGNEYLLSYDIDAAVAVFGDANGELGASIAAANGADVIWTAGSVLQARFTSGTGNFGTGAGATNLTAGSITYYVHYTVLP